MKKYIYLFGLLSVVMLTACNNSDEPSNTQTFTMTINSRTIDGDDVVFSQGTGKVVFNYTDMFIKFTAQYKDADGQTHNLTTSDMKMYAAGNNLYSFNNVASSASTGIEMLEGFIDMGTGMMWYSFTVDGSTRVVSTSCLMYAYTLLYAYTNTSMTNPDNGNHGNHAKSAYLFALDSRGETCTMLIGNFISNLNDAIDASEVKYEGLTATPDAQGYRITAEKAESNYKGFYTLTDVDFTINDQCNVVSGSFKCNGLEYTVSGNLFSKGSN